MIKIGNDNISEVYIGSNKISEIYKGSEKIWSGDSWTDTRDGNTYKTVKIDGLEWLAQNFRYLPDVVDNDTFSETEQYRYVKGYEGTDVEEAKLEDNYINYGALYNYNSALADTPTGWRLPTNNDWTYLERYCCALVGDGDCNTKFPLDNTTTGDRGTTEKLKIIDGGESGMNLLLGGKISSNFVAGYTLIGESGCYWSNTLISRGGYFLRVIQFDKDTIWRGDNHEGTGYTISSLGKKEGYSVRYVRDI